MKKDPNKTLQINCRPIITLLLADDHPVAREGVRRILECSTDIFIVGEAQNGADVKELIPQLHPKILLLDLKMPDTSPFEIEKWVRTNYPQTTTLVLTGHDRDFYLAGMIEAGVSGYLDKNERADNLIAAIHRAAHGEVFFTSEQIDRARKWRQGAGKKWMCLTQREREILLLIARGKSNKEIARNLEISLKTVAYHISKIFGRLDVESRSQAIAWLHQYLPNE